MALKIDPHLAERLGCDGHLPPVPQERLTRDALIQRFAAPPPWQTDADNELWIRAKEFVPASVLVPLVMRDQVSVLLTQRTAHLSKHAGQISFPGGRQEPTDPDPVATALREAQEEVGLDPSRVRVLGTLPTYATGTGFMVTPVVGLIDPLEDEMQRLKLQADANEVADIFEVPLPFLMNPQFHHRHALDVSGARFEFFSMPWRPPHEQDREYFIWGATAAMLRNFYRFLSA
ncbi:CoA pyrophosphatase [Aquabacterium sp.]|jgi:8-oxo-dGTP pyrophosphatase MutT (NUDIX family)|uniref:CoA pyrophosphatase n=1 Tax=Aquabacterium sp. TaxID=1872578 RepID=UPI001B6754B5|nr:CoA pyrophosphatase [Aquabacterium sp.]MBP6613203.1 CoA pyrophosphatase [Aquabacterium sp.]MBP6616034.1 CoA pyrophosphatase [Aquabacterium sp.]MBP7502068.1 CoA pyrophosphatase [Aquabacterium sp.]MDD2976667.1 CoA pyrophosphatase [Aquabacterium sp.]